MSCRSSCGSRDKEKILCDGLPEALAAGGTGDEIDAKPNELLETKLELHKVDQAGRPVEFNQHIDVARGRFAPRDRSKQPQVFDVIRPEGRTLPTKLIHNGGGGMGHGDDGLTDVDESCNGAQTDPKGSACCMLRRGRNAMGQSADG